ncbi:hypothetical protein [Deinococcus hohokamensis]|uniref:Uncharacterized protein n=1 Tax=Deinococcus hohokamensis TaxID=309883 RepID=A0ABV9ICL9_9DEIO
MKVRFTARGVRVRIDDLELAALDRGEAQTAAVSWPGGGWALSLDPGMEGVSGEGGELVVGLSGLLGELRRPEQEGVRLPGTLQVDVEKDFGPQHLTP